MSRPSPRPRSVAWFKDDPLGMEFAEIGLSADRLRAGGTAIGTLPAPYRLEYELETASEFVTTRLRVVSRGDGWRRTLELTRTEAGFWDIEADQEGDAGLRPPGGDAARLVDARDCDLGLSPLTNLMPILRHGLSDGGGTVELTAAWVAVPALTVAPDGQRYTHLSERLIRYEALDGSFAADITVDQDGIVVDYPGLARRV
jgi:hypothetical protein